jgi:hypothetical protein
MTKRLHVILDDADMKEMLAEIEKGRSGRPA